jgi:hypothetical protein
MTDHDDLQYEHTYIPPSKTGAVTTDTILRDFARKLTELDERSVRLNGGALSLQDPRDLAAHIRGLADNLEHLATWGEGGDETATAIGAQCIAFLLARARVETLDVSSGGEAA